MKNATFHLALPCRSISETKSFYADLLGMQIGRSTHLWLDVNLLGSQITFTKAGNFRFDYQSYKFDGEVLPSFHFGVILSHDEWEAFRNDLSSKVEIKTEITFLKDKAGEHKSFFVKDPNGYTVEFKCFSEPKAIFKV